MNEDEVDSVVIKVLEKQKSEAFIKDKMMNVFFGAVGALITLLLVGQWQSMDRKSSEALETTKDHRQVADAKFKVLEGEIAQLKAKVDLNHEREFIGPVQPLSLDEFDKAQNQLQQQIDTEIYRTKER